MVRAAGSADPDTRRRAFEALVAAYWKPVYAFIRHKRHDPVEAQDLTQDFSLRFLQGRFAGADPDYLAFHVVTMGADYLFVPWHPFRTAAEMVEITRGATP